MTGPLAFPRVAARQQARRLGARAAALAETRRATPWVFLVSLAVWWLQALVIPLDAGRDLATYLGAYVQLFQAHPIDLGYVLGRTPIAPLVSGGLLQFAGGALAEPVMSVLYAASIVAWFLAARTFSRTGSLFTVLVLLLYPGYGILFHELSSDALFAAAFAGWSLLVVRVLQVPSPRMFALVGAGVGVLALIRPSNQVLLVLALVPLALRASWRMRMFSTLAFVVPAVALIVAWTLNNGLRYDNYTFVRGGNATVPFFRAFVTDRIVRPSNGPASRELARVVRRQLLPVEPYRSYGITLREFFAHPSARMEVDLLALSDRLKGWHSNYRWLRDIGDEAVRAHPATYSRGVLSTTWDLLRQPVYRSPPAARSSRGGGSVVVGTETLPKPTEGEPIPTAHEGGVSTPDGSIYTVWTSPTEHHLVFVHPGDEQRYDSLHRRMDELAGNLPDRQGSSSLAHRLNQASRWFPPPALWIALALVALAYRRPRGARALVVPSLAGLLVIVVSALGLPAEPHYSVPVAPVFVLLAGAVLFAPRRVPAFRPTQSQRDRLRALSGGVAAAAGALAAAWAVKAYVTLIHNAFVEDRAPHDLAVFLRAAGRVLQLDSPYGFRADETYAYPPGLAFLVAPLHPLGAAAATLVWTLVALGALAASLWLLGLRDWRCYAVAFAFPFTRSAIDLGTIGPLLLLAVAAGWRWRENLARSASALGASVALKLYLWPLAAWPALTGRFRTTLAAAAAAVGLILLPWSVLGFAGLGGYPGLLRHLSSDEASSSYSVIALAVRAHLPEAVGVVVSLLVATGLLVAAGAVARMQGREGDALALTLCVAAALAASPIVWIHYFVLLLVPLALTQPRFSLLWLVPFAYYPLGEHSWPAGDAGKLGLALVTTCVILGAAVLTDLRPRRLLAHEESWPGRMAVPGPRKLEQPPKLHTGPP
jgi:Glycosyltransferase family 87/Dolichyl-phosphate-mannose-protein mannosyltransferase